MTSPVAERLLTVDEFLEMDHAGYELVHGQLKEKPLGTTSSWVGGNVYGKLYVFLEANPIGFVLPQDTVIAIWPSNPRHARKPECFFISNANFRTTSRRRPSGFTGPRC